jgi:hypothetical protein
VDNYFEGIDFTKIEIILLIGSFLVFLPFVYWEYEYIETEIQRNVIVEYLDTETQREMAIAELSTNEKDKIETRSEWDENKIFIVFGVTMFLLILTAYLSRKGYTSYTPWLEKLANDKLVFDMKLFQLVDDKKLEDFYRTTFKLGPKKISKKSDVVGWKPIKDDEKWYSVFTEKIDYRFCEIFFTEVYSDWNKLHYEIDTNDQGEYVKKEVDSVTGELIQRDLYKNPELVPYLSNSELKKKLEENKGALLEKIIGQITIFNVDEKKKPLELEKIKKLMTRKIQIDLLYYAVMTNFRVGLLNATERWLNADDLLKKSEKETDEDARASDVGAGDLNDAVQDILKNMEERMGKRTTYDWYDILEEGKDAMKEELNEESKKKLAMIKEKMGNRNNWESDEWRAMGSVYYKWREAGNNELSRIRRFASKLHITNIDTQITIDDYGIRTDIADKTYSERFSSWWNRHIHGIYKEVESDPTEEKWKTHRTVRAVNSLSNSFGFIIDKKPGGAVLFFGVVFGLIIAVALTNSLDIVIEAMQLPDPCDVVDSCWHTDWAFLYSNIENYSYVIILFFCFFPLGILFYHQGTILLSAKAAEQMTMGSKGLVFVNFLFILLQAIVVYFLASSIGDVTSFLYLLILLVTIDASWVVIFTAKDMTDDVRDAPVFIEWIILDIIIGMFAWVILMNYESVPEVLGNGWTGNLPIFLMILVVLTTRAAVDYSYGWKNFWSKFADAE